MLLIACLLACGCSFSCRHLIFKLPNLAFADACHAGRFARCVLLRLLAVGLHSSSHAQLLVINKDGGLTTFVDMGVYTRNRWVTGSLAYGLAVVTLPCRSVVGMWWLHRMSEPVCEAAAYCCQCRHAC